MKKFIATKNDEGRTIYKFLLKVLKDVPLSKIEKLFRTKNIRINNEKITSKKIIIKEKDEILIYQVFSNFLKSKKTPFVKKDFEIIFEDKNILIVNKKENISIHGFKDSLDNQVLSYLNWKQKDSFTPSHIGRLDKVTSGIVVYAKNYFALRELKTKWRNVIKIYQFKSDLENDRNIKVKLKFDSNLKRTVESKNGTLTRTNFFIKDNKKYARIFTGFKHQIRATLKFLECPIYGDTKYGGKKDKRVFLHACFLQFKSLSGLLKYLNNKSFSSTPSWEN